MALKDQLFEIASSVYVDYQGVWSCISASKEIISRLKAAGLPAERIDGTYCCSLHTRIHVGEFVVDVTGSQFRTGLPDVFVGTQEEYKKYDTCPDAALGSYGCEHFR